MIDLRRYENLIRELVDVVDNKDPNWPWTVVSVTETEARIRWGYLDYMDEKNNGFVLLMDNDVDGTGVGDWLFARHPDGVCIECYLVVDDKPNPKLGAERRIENGIRSAIEEIAYVAHSQY